MTLIIYGGDRAIVENQLACEHHGEWSNVSIDFISRYNKCKKCFALLRDVKDWNEYLKLERLAEENRLENRV